MEIKERGCCRHVFLVICGISAWVWSVSWGGGGGGGILYIRVRLISIEMNLKLQLITRAESHNFRSGFFFAQDLGCLPFTQRFQYFRMENKWNTHFWSTQPENYRNKGLLQKVVLFDRLEHFKRFISFHLHFFWVVVLVPNKFIICFYTFRSYGKWKAYTPNGIFQWTFLRPFAQLLTRWFFHVNGKQH